jgi:hypothetical protein
VPDPTSPTADLLVSAVTPCLDPAATGARVFGLSVLYQHGAIVKPYFAGDDPLSRAERTCIAAAIKGLAGADAPASGVVQYVGRGSASALTITLR